MATIQPYETKSGRRYRVRYRKPDNRQTDKRGFKTKRDAQLWAAENTTRIADGSYTSPADGRATVAEIAEHWLSVGSHLKESSRTVYRTAYDTHVDPEFGNHAVANVSRAHVRRWVSDLSKRRSARTVRRAHYILQAVLQYAVEEKRISENPAREIKTLPRIRHRKNVYLSYAEVERLADAADEHRLESKRGVYGLIVRIAAYTALRWVEIITLTDDDIDLDGRRVRVRAEVAKSSEERSVGMPEFLVDDIQARMGGGRLFPSVSRPVNAESWWATAVKRAGLPETLVFHDLRHSAISFAVSAGASIKVIQNMAGHRSAVNTLDVYSDILSWDVDDVAERVSEQREQALGRE